MLMMKDGFNENLDAPAEIQLVTTWSFENRKVERYLIKKNKIK